MEQKPEIIEVNTKHLKLRFVLFALAVVIGIVAFGTAFFQLSNRTEGCYEITAARDEDIPLYANGIHLFCYLSGKSNAIKADLKEAESIYTESLSRIYRLLDADQTYEGYVNLATLNEQIGQPVALPVELYTALTDAIDRSEAFGRNPYDTALRRAWEELLYLESPQDADPLHSPIQRERMEALAAAVREQDAIRLDILDATTCTVRLTVSESLQNTLQAWEMNGPVLDLGLLREAYTLKYVAGKLRDAGFTHGYLETDSGLKLLLPDSAKGDLLLYGLVNDAVVPAASVPVQGGMACCTLYTFPLEKEYGYYSVEGVLRHPYLMVSGEPNTALLTVWVLAADGDIVDAAVEALTLMDGDAETAYSNLERYADGASFAAVVAVDAPEMIYTDAGHMDLIAPMEGFTVFAP